MVPREPQRPDPRTRGLVFLREMDLAEFFRSSRKLKQLLESR
jgi:hypothetical protein